MRILRISHSAVVDEWRERERQLRALGHDVVLLSATVWDEGGRPVRLAGDDRFARPVRTVGRHPNLFVYDPRPIWAALAEPTWDVLDIHEEPCSVAAFEVLLLARLRRVGAPVVLYSAQNIDKRYPVPFRWFERRALRVAAGLSVCNAAAGEILRRKGFRGVTAEIPLGVNVELFAPIQRTPPADGALRVGYVGRLVPHKGVDVLLQAVGQLPRCTLDVVGDGPQAKALRSRASAPDLAGRVRFRGHHADVATVYPEWDVVAVPSLPTPNWLEQFGRVVVEAMASGVPVVASDSGALPDVVADAGLLVPPGDVDQWTQALDHLANHPDQWTRLRKAGLARARDFTWASVARDLAGLYSRITGAADDPRPLEVLVVAYGAPDLLRSALAPLAGQLPILIVDNSSSASVRAVADEAGARYLDPGVNGGFAAGVNAGLAALSDPTADVLLLNPDAVIAAEEMRRLHERLLQDPRLAAVAPAQHDGSGLEGKVRWPFPSPARAWVEAAGFGRLNRGRGFLIGAVLLLRREAIDDVGAFDERFFLYAEETDWQRRAVDRGWRLALEPDIVAEHIGAGTATDAGVREKRFHAAQEVYIRKHFGGSGWQVYRAAVIAGAALRLAVGSADARRRARWRLTAYLRGPANVARSDRGAYPV